MRAQVRKLGFVTVLLVWLAYGNPPVVASPPATDGWCYCYNPNVSWWYLYKINSYIYYSDEQYGPWQFRDQRSAQSEIYFGFTAAYDFCFNHCLSIGINNADAMCDQYGNANHHVQVQFTWHWEDTDGDLYNRGGDYDSGSTTIIWCQ